MPRQPNSEIRLKCAICKNFTQTINPIIITKLTENRYYIKAICSICNKFKSKVLNKEQIKLLPNEIQQAADNTTFINTIERNGGLLPIIPLIGAIAMGISALASAGGATASAIISAKNFAEQERHNKQLEDIARGNGISNDVIKTDQGPESTSLNGIGINPLLVSSIISIIPELIKVAPEAANKIKQLIDGNGNKVDKPKVLSDDELIYQSINFLRGKRYDVSM